MLFVLILSSAIFVKLAFSKSWFISYLSLNRPVSPELLILEGWVSDTTLRLAAKEFHEKSYVHILTSGSPTDPYYLLAEDGYLEYSFVDQPLSLHKNDTISFTLKGTPVQLTYPEYTISVNDQQVSSGFTTGSWDTYSHIMDSATSAEIIRISFVNDTYLMGEDRNLQVKSMNINSTQYLARSKNVLNYKLSDHQRTHPLLTYFTSLAEECAHELQEEGIPKNLIDAVPSPVSQNNRTLASAIMLSSYFESRNLPYSQVNIISEGIHARRTWISYKFAFRKQVKEVGIICVNVDRSYNTGLPSYTHKEILRELGSIIYYKLFFNKNRYRKKLIHQYPPV